MARNKYFERAGERPNTMLNVVFLASLPTAISPSEAFVAAIQTAMFNQSRAAKQRKSKRSTECCPYLGLLDMGPIRHVCNSDEFGVTFASDSRAPDQRHIPVITHCRRYPLASSNHIGRLRFATCYRNQTSRNGFAPCDFVIRL